MVTAPDEQVASYMVAKVNEHVCEWVIVTSAVKRYKWHIKSTSHSP